MRTRVEAHSPGRILARAHERIAACRKDLVRAVSAANARRRDLLLHQERLIHSYSHEGVLERGYALIWSEGGARLHRSGTELRPGMEVEIELFDVRAGARVTDVAPKAAEPAATEKEAP